MGYKIQYDPQSNYKFPANMTRPLLKKWCVGAILLTFLVVGTVIAGNNGMLKNILYPGDPDVTSAALREMLSDIRAGESVKEAVTEFCIEIIENA